MKIDIRSRNCGKTAELNKLKKKYPDMLIVSSKTISKLKLKGRNPFRD